MFHADEMAGVRSGKVLCTDCALDYAYHEFLAEVMEGKHPELMQMLRERLEEGE